MLKKIGLVVLVFSFVFVMGAGSAGAVLTTAALSVTSSGALTINSTGAVALTIAPITTSNATGTIVIGATAGTGAITVGSSSAAQTLNLGTGAGVSTINVGTGVAANVITIGGGAGTVAVNSGDWDISTTGAMTGIGAITMDGTLTLADTSTITTGVIDETRLSSFVITPKDSVTGGSYTVHELFKINGDSGFGDVGAYTYGIQASFDRAAATTSDILGFDTGFDLRVTNDAINNAAYDLQGMNIKVRNKSGKTVDTMRGINLEIAEEGTTGSAVGLNINGSGTFTDIVLQNGEVINNGTDGTISFGDAKLKTTGIGSAAAPAYAINNSGFMGMYGSSAVELAFSTQGVKRGQFDSDGFTATGIYNTAIGLTSPSTGAFTNIVSGTYNFASPTVVAGTGDAITMNFSPDFPALAAGLEVTFIAESANTTAVTLAIDGGAVIDVKKITTTIAALAANDIRAGQIVRLIYDGAQWQMISPTGN